VARIIVTGYMIRYPVGGNLLAFLSYVVGLRRLGHQVVYLEVRGWSGSCFDPRARSWGDDPAAGLAIVRGLVEGEVIYIDETTGTTDGRPWPAVKDLLGEADLLLDVGGVSWLPEMARCRRRALVDMDPLFTQIGKFGGVGRYQTHFSYGLNVGLPGCAVPSGGVPWLPTVPPVIIADWRATAPAGAPWTTIAHWSAYGAVEWRGERYGQKDEEFLRVLELPAHTAEPLELAVSGVPAEVLGRFRAAGWSVRDPGDGVSASPRAYRSYIEASRGEFSVAKNAYVKTRSGWFSDRTVCYLAAGLPAVVQDTGFSDHLPCGEGLLPFADLEGAARALAAAAADHPRHRAAARRLAGERFSYDIVLPPLVARALQG
jgi:hypothetical protein